MVTSVTCFRLSFSAICVAVVITASAKAHSCIKKQKHAASIKHIAQGQWIKVSAINLDAGIETMLGSTFRGGQTPASKS